MGIAAAAVAAILVIVVALFTWGVVRLRRNADRLHAAMRALSVDEIPELAGQCAHVFASRLESPLDSSDPLACARALDRLVPTLPCASAFARPELQWAYVLHCGAYLGELIRMHAGARWQAHDDGAPGLVMQHGEITIQLWPFDKILKHRMQGEPGDLAAYVRVALQGPEAIAAKTGTEG